VTFLSLSTKNGPKCKISTDSESFKAINWHAQNAKINDFQKIAKKRLVKNECLKRGIF